MIKQPADKHKKNSIASNLRTIAVALLLAIGFRSFAFEPFHIPTGSMKDTLLVGDYLFVSKYSYGYSRYSFPFGLPLFEGRLMQANQPRRGDVVVFRFPQNPRVDFIKRLVGLPGDHIQVKEGILYINDKPMPREPNGEFTDDENKLHPINLARFKETLPEGRVINILKQYKIGSNDNTELFIVPEHHYFLMGDNRDNSNDSRKDVGFVPEENIVGRAEVIFFSTDGSSSLTNPVSWFSAMRLGRFFKRIE